MTMIEIWAVAVMCGATVILLSVMWKFKRMNDDRRQLENAEAKAKEDRERVRQEKVEERRQYEERAKLRMHPNYSHARFDPQNPDVLLPTKHEIAKRYSQTQTVGNNSIGVQSGSSTTVVHDSSNDLLTNILLYKMMTDNSNKVAVQYDNVTGRIETKTYDEPVTNSDSNHSSSYSSSSDDDSSSRSSYSSSYSSSSDDSSYSSSSSDSSSSSWD